MEEERVSDSIFMLHNFPTFLYSNKASSFKKVGADFGLQLFGRTLRVFNVLQGTPSKIIKKIQTIRFEILTRLPLYTC